MLFRDPLQNNILSQFWPYFTKMWVAGTCASQDVVTLP